MTGFKRPRALTFFPALALTLALPACGGGENASDTVAEAPPPTPRCVGRSPRAEPDVRGARGVRRSDGAPG